MSHAPQTRRAFLRALGLSGLGLGLQPFLSPRFAMAQSTGAGNGRNLIVINLFGGIDGLAAFPYMSGSYVDLLRNTLRPTLATDPHSVLSHGGQGGSAAPLGFHPAFAPLVSRADSNLSLIQNYGIPGDPGRSHDTCQILMSLGATELTGGDMVGFLARLMDLQNWNSFQYWAFATENPSDTNTRKRPPVMVSDLSELDIPSIGWESDTEGERAWELAGQLLEFEVPRDPLSETLAATRQTMRSTIGAVRSDISAQTVGDNLAGNYSSSPLGASLRDTMKLLRAKISAPNLENYQKDMLVLTGQGGYDTHSDQGGEFGELVGDLASNLAVFYEDLIRFGLLEDTVILAYSEFGRTAYENGTPGQPSVGTDHGHGNTTFALGGPVTGGVIGDAPTTSTLADQDYNALRPTIDFRDVFGDALVWLGVNPEAVFDSPDYRYRRLGIIRS